ncbi:hypothetical protein [uncultured Megasphaera sp.]|uniref:hypothetical protein n=1 Tax=uncultured Megasphaera sp. TaxID=165188 RepID=UPI0025940630|nr:hypothetical protein [uncultured Megasphaera sp.]
MPKLYAKYRNGVVSSYPLYEKPAIDCMSMHMLMVKLKGKQYYTFLDSEVFSNIRFRWGKSPQQFGLYREAINLIGGSITAIMHDDYTISTKESIFLFSGYQNMQIPTLEVLPLNLAVNIFREKTPIILNCPKVKEIQEQSVLCRGAVGFTKTLFWAPNLVKIKNGAFAENVTVVCISENCDVSNCDNWGLGNDTTIVTWDRSKKLNLETKGWEDFSGGVIRFFDF